MKEIERGHKAGQLLDNEMFQEASKHVESEIFRMFEKVHPTDIEALSQIKAMQYMHGKYLAFLRNVIQNGNLAQLEIERKSKLAKLRDRFTT